MSSSQLVWLATFSRMCFKKSANALVPVFVVNKSPVQRLRSSEPTQAPVLKLWNVLMDGWTHDGWMDDGFSVAVVAQKEISRFGLALLVCMYCSSECLLSSFSLSTNASSCLPSVQRLQLWIIWQRTSACPVSVGWSWASTRLCWDYCRWRQDRPTSSH